MSWDVLLLSVPPGIATVDDSPEDFASELGPRAQVLSTLAALFPDLDLSDPTWGILAGDDFAIEFNIGDGDPVETIMLHVRGSNSTIHAIHYICERTGWRAFDTSTGDLLTLRPIQRRVCGNGGLLGIGSWPRREHKATRYCSREIRGCALRESPDDWVAG
jgi:hypothetical protein